MHSHQTHTNVRTRTWQECPLIFWLWQLRKMNVFGNHCLLVYKIGFKMDLNKVIKTFQPSSLLFYSFIYIYIFWFNSVPSVGIYLFNIMKQCHYCYKNIPSVIIRQITSHPLQISVSERKENCIDWSYFLLFKPPYLDVFFHSVSYKLNGIIWWWT